MVERVTDTAANVNMDSAMVILQLLTTVCIWWAVPEVRKNSLEETAWVPSTFMAGWCLQTKLPSGT